MIDKISQILDKNRIFNKVEGNCILTKKSKTKIPEFNADIAYLMGVIFGDGTMIKASREKGGFYYILRIYEESKSYLTYLRSLINKNFGYQGKIYRDLRKKNLFILTIQNAVIFHYFLSLGLNIGKEKAKYTPEIIKKDKEVFFNYCAGLVDTDGSISSNRIQLKQKYKNVMEELASLLNRFDLNSSPVKINYTNLKPFYYIRFDNKLPLRYKG